MKKMLFPLFILLISLILFGCNSVPTHGYRITTSVEKSIVMENKVPKELNGKALLVVGTLENTKQHFKLKKANSKIDKYCHAELDKHSFVAVVVEPGEYFYQTTKLKFEENQIIFLATSTKGTELVSSVVFLNKFKDKSLSKIILSSDKDIIPANEFFKDKISGSEEFGYYTGMTLLSPLLLIYGACYGVHYLGFVGMFTFFPPFMIAGAILWGATYFIIPEDHRCTFSNIAKKTTNNNTNNNIDNNQNNVNVNVNVHVDENKKVKVTK